MDILMTFRFMTDNKITRSGQKSNKSTTNKIKEEKNVDQIFYEAHTVNTRLLAIGIWETHNQKLFKHS